MKIIVKYYGFTREVTGKNYETIIMQTDQKLKDIIYNLIKRYSQLSQIMLNEEGEPSDYLTYFIEGVNIHSLQGFNTVPKDGSTVVIAPTIVGG